MATRAKELVEKVARRIALRARCQGDAEKLDPRPLVVHAKNVTSPRDDFLELVMQKVRAERLMASQDAEFETPQEADDFDVEADDDFLSRYEVREMVDEMPEEGVAVAASEAPEAEIEQDPVPKPTPEAKTS